jgi:hypothetical protein
MGILSSIILPYVTGFLSFVYPNWLPLFMRLFLSLTYMYDQFKKQINKTISCIANSFQDDTYFFYEGSNIPMKHSDNITNFSEKSAEWLYSKDINYFLDNPLTDTYNSLGLRKKQKCPCLSASLVVNDDLTYDISPWLESLDVLSNNKYPTWSILVNAWLLSKKINYASKLAVKIFTFEGDEEEILIKDAAAKVD